MRCKKGHEINPLTGRCVVICKEGYERNPRTGRCKKVNSRVPRVPRVPRPPRVPTSCRQGFEINPLTGRCVKICKEGFERNPVTGRCKKITKRPAWNPSTRITRIPENPARTVPVTPIRTIPEIIPPKCKEGFEINSLTGRCVKLCKRLFERNPSTGRCKKVTVKRVPIVPRPIPEVRTPVPTRPIPEVRTPLPTITNIVEVPEEFYEEEYLDCHITDEEYHKFINSKTLFHKHFEMDFRELLKGDETNCEKIEKLFPDNLVNKISHFLGQGAYGGVFSNIEANGEKNAIKIAQAFPLEFKKELRIANKFYNLGVSIKVIESGEMYIENSYFNKHQFFKMGVVHGTVGELLDYKVWNEAEIYEIVSKIFQIIKKISDNKLLHGDLHFYNIGFIYDNKNKLQIKLIDFGRSRERSRPKADIALLLRGSQFLQQGRFPKFVPHETTFVRDTFIRLVQEMAKNMFGFDFPEFRNTGLKKMDTMTMNILLGIFEREMFRR